MLSEGNEAIVLITSDFSGSGKKFNNQPPCTAVVVTELMKKSLSPKKKKSSPILMIDGS